MAASPKIDYLSAILPILFISAVLLGFVFLCVYTVKTRDRENWKKHNGYRGKVNFYRNEEIIRDSIFQLTVTGSLLIIVFRMLMVKTK